MDNDDNYGKPVSVTSAYNPDAMKAERDARRRETVYAIAAQMLAASPTSRSNIREKIERYAAWLHEKIYRTPIT